MNRTYRRIPALVAFMLLPLLSASAQRKGQAGGAPGGKKDIPPVVTVNGQGIPFSRFQALYNDQISYLRKIGERPTVDQSAEDQLLLRLIDAELYRQEAAKRKVNVSREEAMKLLLKDPPEFIRTAFIDDKGVFHKDIFQQVVTNPSLITRMVASTQNPDTVVARWKEDLEEVIGYVQDNETRRRLGEALLAEKPLTPKMIRDHYMAERTRFTGSFIRVLHNTIADSVVSYTDQELRSWYDTHLDDYRFPSARYLATLILPVFPVGSDTARHKQQMEEARSLITKASPGDRGEMVSTLLRALPPNRFPTDRGVSLAQIPANVRESVSLAKPGDLVGPVPGVEGEDVFFYIDAITPGTDTVARARHILIKVDEEEGETDSGAVALLNDIRDSIPTEDRFREIARIYSDDGSAAQGGDLGFFRRGATVRQFDSVAFTAPTGRVIGPIKTQFGYHLMWVSQRIAKDYRIRELRFQLSPAAEARQVALQEAESYASALRSGDQAAIDSIYSYLKGRYPRSLTDSTLLKRLDIYGDALTVATFGFNAQVGDVGVIQAPYDRVVIAKLLQIWPTGVAPYDKIRENYVIPHVVRSKQLAMLKPIVARLRDTMTADMTLGNIRLVAPWAEAFMLEKQMLTPALDEDPSLLDSLVEQTPDSGISGPVLGKHAYYFLRIVKRQYTPTESDFQRDRATYAADYTERYRQKMLADLLERARQYAEVQDNRGARRQIGGPQ